MTDTTDRRFAFSPSFRLTIRVIFAVVVLSLTLSCAGIPGIHEEQVTNVIRVPFVRVLLNDNAESVSVSADQAFAVECLRGGEQEVFYSSQPISARMGVRKISVLDRGGEVVSEGLDEVNIIPRGSNNRLMVNNKRYRGIMKILPQGHNVRLVNVLYMEDYLRGVVPPEIGPREENEIEAIKAQAVAARTYSMAHLQQYEGEPYDMRSSVADQVYEGADAEVVLVNNAIDLTAGTVAMYNDAFINAYYHSTCGGITDNIEQVWDKKEEPYLKSREDSSDCSWSKYYVWKESFTEPQLRGRIEQYLSTDRGRDIRLSTILDVKVEERTAGGRVSKMVVRTVDDNYRFTKDRVRWVIGRASNPDLILPSAGFDVAIERDSEGYTRNIVFNGRGYGHGVGMCQCGAIGKARRGELFDQILSAYYTGISLKKLY